MTNTRSPSWLGITGSIVLFLGVTEPEFYHEFHTRLNNLPGHPVFEKGPRHHHQHDLLVGWTSTH